MKLKKISFIVIGALFLAVFPAFGQGDAFTDVNVAYSFSLPDAKWKMTVKPSATSPNVEYVYGDRMDGHLEVRKITVAKDAILTDLVRAEETKLQFRYGFVPGREENFNGRLRGTVYNFEFVAAGRPMSGRFYLLRADDNTVYVLRFSGEKDSLRSLRNQADAIARTFSVK